MGRERVSIGYLMLGVLTVAALVGALTGISWSPGPRPVGLDRAVAATRALATYAVSTTVLTSAVPTSGQVPSLSSYLTVTPAAARLTVETNPVAGGTSSTTTSFATTPGAIDRLASGFHHYLSLIASASNVTWRGSRYTFSVPARDVAQPGLPGFTVAQARATMAVTVVGDTVGTITVAMTGYGATQYQTLDLTTPAVRGQF